MNSLQIVISVLQDRTFLESGGGWSRMQTGSQAFLFDRFCLLCVSHLMPFVEPEIPPKVPPPSEKRGNRYFSFRCLRLCLEEEKRPVSL